MRVAVDIGDGEPIESALRRFKREVSKSSHLMDLRHKRYFENPQEKKKRKVKEGRLRIKFERLAKQRAAKNRS
jgi:small subunit ribosomal protein S21